MRVKKRDEKKKLFKSGHAALYTSGTPAWNEGGSKVYKRLNTVQMELLSTRKSENIFVLQDADGQECPVTVLRPRKTEERSDIFQTYGVNTDTTNNPNLDTYRLLHMT